MIGFLVGTACLIGLIKTVRHGRFGGGYGGGSCGGPMGRHGGDEHGFGGRGGFGRRGFGPRFFLRSMFERLDTTPGQEKVIVQAVDELRDLFGKAKDEMKGTRADAAAAFRSDVLDESTLAGIFTKHDTVISETRRSAVESLHKIHDALSAEQRKQVADFLESGPRGGRGRWGGGPYRQWA